MSKYSSLCTAINLIEVISRMMAANGGGKGRTAEVVADLQDVAKDVRYGGKWEGDYETLAEALTCCRDTGINCGLCPYHKNQTGCVARLKGDAAAAIRQLSKLLQEAEAKLQQAEDRAPATWQKEIMAKDNPPDIFPWEDDPPQFTPVEEVGAFE